MQPLISITVMGQAIQAVERMDLRAREALVDEIYAHQPTLLGSVLVLQRLGATLAQVDIILSILLVAYQAMKLSGHAWPTVTEMLHERCLDRLVGKMLFLDGLDASRQTEALQQQTQAHGEPNLLAFVVGRLQEHDLLDVKTDAIKHMTLAAVNLADCVAATRTTHTTKAVRRRAARQAKSMSR